MQGESRNRFVLSKPPLLRLYVHRRTDDTFQFTLTEFHPIFDGWSLTSTLAEIFENYFAIVENQPLPEAPPTAVTFRDYVALERKTLESTEAQRYWDEKLQDATPLELPRWRELTINPGERRFTQESYHLAADVTEGLKRLAHLAAVPLKNVLLAAHFKALSVICGQQDIVTGMSYHGRPEDRDGDQVRGLFINTVPFRVKLGSGNWVDLVQQTFEAERELMPFKRYPLATMQKTWGRKALLETSFNFVHFHSVKDLFQSGKLQMASGDLGLESTSFTLDVAFILRPTNFELNLVLGRDRLAICDEQINAIRETFMQTLSEMATDPLVQHSSRCLISAEDQRRIIEEWNNTATEFPDDKAIHQIFETQAAQTPDRVALTFEATPLTYRELNEQANRLAHYLHAQGIGTESRVGILLERSPEMVISLLATLKAGAAYVPLDPTYPKDRLAFMMEDAQVPLLLTQRGLATMLPAHSVRTVCLDEEQEIISRESSENPACRISGENLAYVIFTSGSTGKPKGAMNTHGAILNRLLWMQEVYGLNETDSVLQKTPFSFDVSVWEFFWPLMMGARLVVARPGGHQDSAYLVDLIAEQQVTTLHFVPSMLQIFLEESGLDRCESLKRVICSGEALSFELQERFFERMRAELHNLYGPTEAAVDVTYWQCAPHDDRRIVPIGRPIANTQIYLLDENMHLAPVGVTGELFIGGVNLARGYHHRPDLTAEKFIPNPFSERAGERLYRTGDVGRRLQSGEIEYLGRIDEQVKIRGFRIELGEIASVLREQPGVKDCVVLAREDGEAGEKRLVAYVVGEPGAGELSRIELRVELKKRLPEYMLPWAIVMMEELPVTANGKLDRRALPAPDNERPEMKGVYVAPQTPEQEVLANIWSRILRVERVGLSDNFFELGGHSLLAMQLLSRVRDAFRVELPLRSLFESPTLADFAKTIEVATRADQQLITTSIVPVSREGELPVSFAQQRMWFLNQLEPESHLYNMHAGVRLAGALNIEALERTFSEIIKRHEVLRTSFRIGKSGRPVQIIKPPQAVKLLPLDLSQLSAPEQEAQLGQIAEREARQPFDLSQAPLLRVALIHLSEQEHVVLLTMHHIVGDAWSTNVLRREIGQLYQAFSQGQPSPLVELPVQYADFAVWQKQWVESEVLEQQLSYWKQQLGDDLPVLELPLDRLRPAIQTFEGSSHEVVLSESITKAIKTLNREEGVTLFMTVLAAFQTLLHRYNGQDDIIVGSGIANRNRAETENLLGYFVNTLALRVDLSGNPTFRELLGRVREVTLGAYAHQDLPFELLVEKLQPERMANRTPLFQVWCETQTLGGQAGSVPTDLTMTSMKYVRRTAYFDLMLFLTETDRAITGYLEFDTELFDADTTGEMARRFVALMESVSANPDLRLLDIPLGQAEMEEFADSGMPAGADDDEDFFTFESKAAPFSVETETSALL